MADKTFVATIEDFTREKNSTNGNPRWMLHLEGGATVKTKPDTSIAYAIPDPELRDVPVKLTVDGRGNVWNIEPVSE